MSEPNPPTDEARKRRDQLVNDWLDAKSAAEKHTVIAKQLAEALIREVGIGNSHEIMPGVGVRVQAPAKTLNADLARSILSPEQYASICEPTPSAAKAQQLLPGAVLDLIRTSGSRPSVRAL